MKLRITNQLNMIGASLGIAYGPDYQLVWKAQPPLDFTDDIAAVQTGYAAITAKAALVEKADGGASDMKGAAETALEDDTYLLARALTSHYKKTGDLDNLAKVDVSKSSIQRLKTQDLVAKCTEIRDLASVAVTQPDAAKRGVTAARITDVSDDITAFTAVMNTPRGQIVNRSTLIKEIETDTAGLLDDLKNLDDLVLQFDGSETGLRFIEAWKQVRQVVDIGHTTNGDTPAPTPAVATPPAKP